MPGPGEGDAGHLPEIPEELEPPETDDQKILALRRRAAALKQTISKLKATASRSVDLCARFPSPAAFQDLEHHRKRARNTWDELEQNLIESLSIESTTEGKQAYNRAYEIYLAKYEEIEEILLKGINASIQHRTSQSSTTETPPQQPKIKAVSDLRPKEQLLPSNTPVELEQWLEQYDAYHHASGFQHCSPPEQRARFLACLGPQLQATVRARICDSTLVYGEGGCIDIVKKEFLILYPKFARRIELFTAKRKEGQPFSQWVTQVRNMCSVAHLGSITEDDLCALVLFQGERDKELRKLFIAASQQSFRRLEEIGRNHEAGLNAIKAASADTVQVNAVGEAAVAAVQSHRSDNNRGALGQSQRSNSNSNGQSRRNSGQQNRSQQQLTKTQFFLQQHPELRGKCLACGAEDHLRRNCKYQGAQCPKCNARGHLPNMCYFKKNSSQVRSVEVDQNQVHPDPRTSFQPQPPPYHQGHPPFDDDIDTLGSMVSSLSTASLRAVTIGLNGSNPAASRTPRFQLTVKAKGAIPFSCSALPDTGAEMTIIPKSLAVAHNLSPDPSLPAPRLFAANGQEVQREGMVKLQLQFGDNRATVHGLISGEIQEFVVSCADLVKLGIISPDFPNVQVGQTSSSCTSVQANSTTVDFLSVIKQEFSDVLRPSGCVPPMKGPPRENRVTQGHSHCSHSSVYGQASAPAPPA